MRVKNVATKPINWFEEFQRDLKRIDEPELVKLKNSIIRNGFNAPIFVWGNKILDGHQRIKAVKELLKEGYSLTNGLPYVEIEADNEKQATELILTYNSQYGRVNDEGLQELMESRGLNPEELASITTLSIPVIPEKDFSILNASQTVESVFTEQLFFTSEEHKAYQEFIEARVKGRRREEAVIQALKKDLE